MSVRDRLARLLYIVPYVEHRDGVTVDEVAEKVGVSAKQIEKDVALLSMVGRPPLTPDHLIDLYIEDGVVYVELDQSLKRPLRLTHDEARALVLGVRMMGDLSGYGEALEGIVETISEHLNASDRQLVQAWSEGIVVSQDTPQGLGPMLREAVEAKERIEVSYYSLSSNRNKKYRLEPLAVIQHTGVEYVLARDVDAELREKLFRLDRMSEASPCGISFEVDEAPDLSRFQQDKLVPGDFQLPARVYFSAQVAAGIKEQFAPSQIESLDDGGLIVTLEGASLGWLSRWVLPFGSDAEVMAPESLRQAIGQRCQEALALYA